MLYGANNIDQTKPIYVVEGQFDSMFLPNCVAVGSSNLVTVAKTFDKNSCTLVYDNQRRNDDIYRAMQRAIDQDFSVVIWPDSITEKDINEMFIA